MGQGLEKALVMSELSPKQGKNAIAVAGKGRASEVLELEEERSRRRSSVCGRFKRTPGRNSTLAR